MFVKLDCEKPAENNCACDQTWGESVKPAALTYVSLATGLPIVILQFLTVCWADSVSKQDEDRRIVDPSPEARSSAFGAMFFAWMDNLLWRGYRKNLLYEDLPPMPVECDEDVKRTYDENLHEPN